VLKYAFVLVISEGIFSQITFYLFGWDYLSNLSTRNEIRNYMLIPCKHSICKYLQNQLFCVVITDGKKNFSCVCADIVLLNYETLFNKSVLNEKRAFKQDLSRTWHYIHGLD